MNGGFSYVLDGAHVGPTVLTNLIINVDLGVRLSNPNPNPNPVTTRHAPFVHAPDQHDLLSDRYVIRVIRSLSLTITS